MTTSISTISPDTMDIRNPSNSTHAVSTLDPLTADCKILQACLQDGKETSLSLVDIYLGMIEKHDHYLHAMISLVPRQKLKVIADELDAERKDCNLRSPLHGIPIIIKDNIATHPEMGVPTTCGALALSDMRPFSNAKLVDQLVGAGLIIIGKANQSELSYFRSYTMPSGWSANGGQCQSAYVRGGFDPEDSKDGHSNPSGSSSGSAVEVSAGYAPFSIGSETDGSLVSPAGRAALYTIKPTIGLVSQEGIIPISHTMDTAGPMAKTPYDLALLLDVIREPGNSSEPPFVEALNDSWANLSVAAVNYETWWLEADILKPVERATKQMHAEIQTAYDKIKSLAAKFVENVPLVLTSEYELEGRNSEYTVMMADFKEDFEKYLKSAEHSQVRSIRELVDFNLAHADVELKPPYGDQDVLLDTVKLDLSVDEYNKHLNHMRNIARTKGLDHIFKEYGVDIIIGPCDSELPALASGSGYPIAAVPLGYVDFNGRPFGLAALAGKDQEAKLFNFMSAWEATFGPRMPPPLLQG